MNDDYIELTDPNEVIREGDFLFWADGAETEAECTVGETLGKTAFVKIERPRSTVIRDAAIELLRKIYDCTATPLVPIHTIANDAWKLKEALGLSIEELRGEA